MRQLLLVGVLVAVALGLAGAASPARSGQARWVLRDLLVSGTPVALNDRGQILWHRQWRRPNKWRAWVWEKGRLTGLGTLGGETTSAADINEHGQVVGSSEVVNGYSRAFLWQHGAMMNLGLLGGFSSAAMAVNERGQVVGQSDTNNGYHAFMWRDGRMRNLGTLGGSLSGAVAINERGQVVGLSSTKRHDQNGDPVKHAFLWQNGAMTDLNPPGALYSGALAINERGQVLIETFRVAICHDPGLECDKAPIDVHAWLWRDGKFINIGTLGGSSVTAGALNDNGQVIGYGKTGKGRTHAFRWQNGTMTDLGTLSRFPNAAYGATDLNNRGQVIGVTLEGQAHAWVWDNGKMTDLGSLGSGYAHATAINEHSQITGWSYTKNGKYHFVLWTLRPGS